MSVNNILTHTQRRAENGRDAGLRCGEMMALEWTDVDLTKRQLTVARSEWKGHVTMPKGGRLRHPAHTFCSHLAMCGAPARAIQELAGHQDLTTTQRYMHLSPQSTSLGEVPPEVWPGDRRVGWIGRRRPRRALERANARVPRARVG